MEAGTSMIIYLQILETQDDQSKFEQIYLEYRNLMFYVAYGILRNDVLFQNRNLLRSFNT